MDFDQLIEFLEGHRGAMVEVSIYHQLENPPTPYNGIATFSGRLHYIGETRSAGPGGRVVHLAVDAVLPDAGSFYLRRDTFLSWEVEAEPPSEPEDRQESGTTWTLTVNQTGPGLSLMFYV